MDHLRAEEKRLTCRRMCSWMGRPSGSPYTVADDENTRFLHLQATGQRPTQSVSGTALVPMRLKTSV